MASANPPVKKEYTQKSILRRIEAFFLDNVGRVVTNDELKEVARDPVTGKEPEDWHQRVSELRTDYGYTIYSQKDGKGLKVGEYLLPTADKRPTANKRVTPSPKTWEQILENAQNKCQWTEDGMPCLLKDGDIDPIGGGRVHLTPDHLTPHSVSADIDPNDPTKWRALCSRHQVTKKNYWDSRTGEINYIGLIQAAPRKIKIQIFSFLKEFFGEK